MTWLSDPRAARKLTLLLGEPLFIYGTMPNCPACLLQEEVWADQAVGEALAGWVCLRLDITTYPDEALRWRLLGAPAFRATTVLGRVVAEHDGYLQEGDLVDWLSSSRTTALRLTEEPGRALGIRGPLTDAQVGALVDLLKERTPELREAAIARLAREGERAAAAVVEAWRSGGLGTRLSALEIFSVWEAPLGEADPWRPETLEGSTDRLARWLARGEFGLALPTRAEMDGDFEALLSDDEGRAAGALTRLTRVGPDLLTETRERLAQETRDRARERLTQLRYRLVIPPDLAREHPGPVAALVSTRPGERAQAVDALARLGGSELEPLFLELFQDPDPLVREVALHALRQSVGSAANTALAELLSDPQPNVRAQVLKELAESPSADVVPILAEYVQMEEDEDLVTHAVRVLTEIKTAKATDTLASLADHESWQVRAEMAQALGKRPSRYGSRGTRLTPQGLAALKTLLGDADTFVVAKAVEAVGEADIPAVEELSSVAERFPELAAHALTVMAGRGRGRTEAVPHLRKFISHALPETRAAALLALVRATNSNVSAELEAAFADADTQVRQAAATGVWTMATAADSVPTAVSRQWSPYLETMLTAEEPRERLEAARALVSLKTPASALPVLKELSRNHGELRAEVGESLEFMEWKEREELFQHLRGLDVNKEDYDDVLGAFARNAPAEALAYLWAEVDEGRGLESPAVVYGGLLEVYLGREGRWDKARRSSAMVRRMGEDARKRLQASDERVATLALALLASADDKQAAKEAEKLFSARDTPPALQRNAFAVLTLFRSSEQVDRAVAQATSTDAAMRTLALTFLADGNGSTYCRSLMVGKNALYLSYVEVPTFRLSQLPRELTVEMLTPLLSDRVAGVRTAAAYLLARREDASGIKVLATAWRQGEGHTEQRYLVEAIVALNGDALTPLLEEVYNSMDRDEDTYSIRDLYWKIRPMSGPKVLALRKRIRDDVGMASLR